MSWNLYFPWKKLLIFLYYGLILQKLSPAALFHFVWIYLIKIFDCQVKVNYHGRGKSKLLWALVWRSGLTGYTMHDIKFRSLCFSPALLYLEVLSWNVLKISLFFWLCPEMSWNLLSKVLEKMEKCPEKSWNVLKFEFWKAVDTMYDLTIYVF